MNPKNNQMKAADLNIDVVESYFTLLKGLSDPHKKALIDLLTTSMNAEGAQPADTSWEALFGSWELGQPAADLILKLKNERSFSRETIELRANAC
jgi:hypothetical protein